MSWRPFLALCVLSSMAFACNRRAQGIAIPEPLEGKKALQTDDGKPALPAPPATEPAPPPTPVSSPSPDVVLAPLPAPPPTVPLPGPTPVPLPKPVPLPAPAPQPTSVPAPAPLPALVLTIQPGPYILKNQGSGRCLDVPYARADEGLGLQIYDCAIAASAAQLFMVQHIGDNYYTITNASNRLSLQIRGGAIVSTSFIEQGTYTGKTHQQFSFKPDSKGGFVIMSRSGNFAVDVVAAAVANETKIQIWPPNDSANERWTLTPP